ncbi:germination protein [Collibacillus ludicampi]|uniref:Germination protein n=1 Tax=Collibacillus ludicampi TaxID=2771369 RepID=A0AAV4LEP7_9BACL|nr:endospore germination permease [Collibacillus ludicampi]GIM46296.1 germination protein [Collibacillus ludicampi]
MKEEIPLYEKKISRSQFGAFAYVLSTATSLIYVPTVTFKIARQDGWISLIFSYMAGIFGILMIHTLIRHYPGKTLVQYTPIALGRIIGKIIGGLYIWFYFHVAVIILREITDFTGTYVLDKTPVVVIVSLLVIVCAYAAYGGVECLGRLMIIIAFLSIIANISLLIFVIEKLDFDKLLPIFDRKLALPIIKGSIIPSAWLGEIVLMATYLPMLQEEKKGKNTLLIILTFSVMLLMITDIFAIAVYGLLTASFEYSVFNLARIINIADFFERVDPAYLAVWVAAIFGKVSLFYLAIVKEIAHWLKLTDYRITIIPVGILLVISSVTLFSNTSEMIQFLSYTFPSYAFIFEYVIPSLVLIVTGIKQRLTQSK